MDKVREALEEKLGAARKRLTDLTISEIMDTSLVDAFDLAADAAREALSALQEAGEAKVRYAGWSPDKGNHYLIESSQPSPAAIRRERERCAKMADAWERPDALRLAAGEMTAQEMRTARAVAKGIAAAIRSLPDQPPAESSPGDAGESGGGHDLETPFYPCIIENHAGGVAEIILRDTTTIYTNELLTARVLRDAETREMIGLQWDIPMRAAAAANQTRPSGQSETGEG